MLHEQEWLKVDKISGLWLQELGSRASAFSWLLSSIVERSPAFWRRRCLWIFSCVVTRIVSLGISAVATASSEVVAFDVGSISDVFWVVVGFSGGAC